MANFEKAIAFVLKHEGGYVNDPKDPGGETKYGICKRNHPTVDIKNLTEDGAKGIYLSEYWLPSGAGKIADDSLALAVFDTAVNMGISRAVNLLARSEGIFAQFLALRKDYYLNLCRIKPNLQKFLKGWLNRVDDLEKEGESYGTV